MSRSADTLITGASVRTLDPARPAATAVAVIDGVIAALDDAATELRGPSTEVIDLAGATLTPGLTDGHTHPLLGVAQFSGLDLSGCRDVADLRGRLAAAARRAGRGEWLRGFGLDHNVFAGQPITSAAIDDVLGGVPAFLRLYDGHSAVASEMALRLARIDGPREFAQRAQVVCDAGGRPTGHLIEHAAMELVQAVMPKVPLAEQRRQGLQSLEGMTSQAALAANEESVAGRIAPGYRADLTAFSVDPVTAPADEVAAAPVRLTMVDGAVTHRAG